MAIETNDPGAATAPDPNQASDLAEFIGLLDRLRMSAGAPSYRTLAKLVGPLMRPPRAMSQSTIGDVFQARRRRLDPELVVAIVRALGADEPAVALWKAAWARAQAAARSGGPIGVFRQLPPDLATFTGREKHLSRLLDLAEPGTGPRTAAVVVTAIEGMAGVGKTRLAVRAAHQLVQDGHYTDAQLYVDLRGFDPDQPPADPAAVLDGFLRQLGVPPAQIPATLDERSAMFRDRVAGQAALVLLDNAADEDQVRPLIPAGARCLALITSRRSLAGLDGAQLEVLDCFTEDEALALLAAVAGVERIAREPEAAVRLVTLCTGLPLAVALVAARLRARPAWSLAAMADRLRDEGLDAMTVGSRAVRAAFDVSFQELPPSAQRMFRVLGLVPGEDFTADVAAAAAGVTGHEARDLLELLCDQYLLLEKAPGRYSLHDLLRAYAAEAVADHADAGPAFHRLLMYYLDTADRADRQISPVVQPLTRELPEGCRPLDFADRDQALRWFEDEYHNLLATLRAAADRGQHLVATELPIMMGGYFTIRANASDSIGALRVAVDSAEELGDVPRLGGALNRLGTALSNGGRPEAAVAALTRAVELGRTIEGGLLWTIARTNLAVVYKRLGELAESERLLLETLPDQRRLGTRVGEGVVLENLAKIKVLTGDYEAAVGYSTQAVEIFRETDRAAELVNALNAAGQAHRALDRLDEALAYHREALDLSRAFRSRRGEGSSLHQLGLTLRAAGDDAAASASLRQAVEAYEEIGDPEAADVTADIRAAESGPAPRRWTGQQ